MLILDLLIGEKALLFDQLDGAQLGEVIVCRKRGLEPGTFRIKLSFVDEIRLLLPDITGKKAGKDLVLDLPFGEKVEIYDHGRGDLLGSILICRPMKAKPGNVCVGLEFPRTVQILRGELIKKETQNGHS